MKGLRMALNKQACVPPLDAISRPAITTREAAHYLNRAQQTLRTWAMRGDGPVQPRRVNGRLAWPTADIRQALGVDA